VFERLESLASRLEDGLAPFGTVQRVGSMLTLFDRQVRNYDDARAADMERYAALFRHLLERGIYIAPSQFEAMFVSLAHTDDDADATVEAVADFFRD
jgi:glutamate-1-semialdehyde 2,1-aminomutase